MPKGGTGRHWRQTPAPGKDAPRCALEDGRTATQAVATVPLCRRHAGAAKSALGAEATSAAVREWVEQQRRAVEPAVTEAETPAEPPVPETTAV